MEFKSIVGWYTENRSWRGVLCTDLLPYPNVMGKYILDEMKLNFNLFIKNIKMLSSFDDYIKGETCPFCGLRGIGSVVESHPALLNHEFAADGEYPDINLQYHTHFIDADKQIVKENSNPYSVLYVYIINEEEINIDIYKSVKDNNGKIVDYGIGKYSHEYLCTIDFNSELDKIETTMEDVVLDCRKYFDEYIYATYCVDICENCLGMFGNCKCKAPKSVLEKAKIEVEKIMRDNNDQLNDI